MSMLDQRRDATPARQSGALCALFIIVALIALTLVGPWLNPNDGQTLDWLHVAAHPALQNAHWFGTDRLGRDLSRARSRARG